MATILTFPDRRTGDWSDAERARLNELAGRFADQTGVEVVFGVTDAGDPWCVLLDAGDEVLVHVARVQGAFVAHTLHGDAFAQSRDLRTVIESVLGPRWQDERADVVVPLALSARHAQLVTAVLVVAAFVEHHSAEAAEEWVLPAAGFHRSPAGGKDGQRDEAAKAAAAVLNDTSRRAAVDLDRAEPDPAPSFGRHEPATGIGQAPPPESPAGPKTELDLLAVLQEDAGPVVDTRPLVLTGTDGSDLLGADRSTPEAPRLLDGGAGDDVLLLDGGTVAIGGAGNDRFVLSAPAAEGSRLLGVILDFDPTEDAFVVDGTPSFSVVARTPVSNVLDALGFTVGGLPVAAGERVGIDFDGDGREDSFLLVSSAEQPVVDSVRDAFIDASNEAFSVAPLPDPAMIAPAETFI